jgi:hypothetical protein
MHQFLFSSPSRGHRWGPADAKIIGAHRGKTEHAANGLRTRVDQGPQLGRALTGSSFGDRLAKTGDRSPSHRSHLCRHLPVTGHSLLIVAGCRTVSGARSRSAQPLNSFRSGILLRDERPKTTQAQ